MAEGTKGQETGDWSYLDENNGIGLEFGAEIWGWRYMERLREQPK
jgi:hypothetical protein